jgi:hypothetical protein
VAILDMSHCLSYAGMPDFITPSGPEKAILFWLAARSLAALALLCAAFWPQRHNDRLGPYARCWSLACVLLIVGVVHYVVLLRPQWMPPTFTPGVGLTPFKIGFEYVLIAAYVLAGLGFLAQLRRSPESGLARLALAAFTMAMGEFFFTLYANVTDVYNVTGHIYKIMACAFLYRGLFVETVQAPYQELQASEARHRAMLDTLPDLLFELSRRGVWWRRPSSCWAGGWTRSCPRRLPPHASRRWPRPSAAAWPAASASAWRCRPACTTSSWPSPGRPILRGTRIPT